MGKEKLTRDQQEECKGQEKKGWRRVESRKERKSKQIGINFIRRETITRKNGKQDLIQHTAGIRNRSSFGKLRRLIMTKI